MLTLLNLRHITGSAETEQETILITVVASCTAEPGAHVLETQPEVESDRETFSMPPPNPDSQGTDRTSTGSGRGGLLLGCWSDLELKCPRSRKHVGVEIKMLENQTGWPER